MTYGNIANVIKGSQHLFKRSTRAETYRGPLTAQEGGETNAAFSMRGNEQLRRRLRRLKVTRERRQWRQHRTACRFRSDETNFLPSISSFIKINKKKKTLNKKITQVLPPFFPPSEEACWARHHDMVKIEAKLRNVPISRNYAAEKPSIAAVFLFCFFWFPHVGGEMPSLSEQSHSS